MTKRDDCKRFEIIKNVGIQDNLTGELLMTMRDCCRVLNENDERANKVVEDTYEEIMDLRGKASSWKITASEQILEQENLMKQIVELKLEVEKLNKIIRTDDVWDVLKKYGIDSAEKLDMILFYQRVW